MAADRRLRLGAFMRPVGIHTAWWRYPGAYPDANFNLKHLIRFAQKLERGRFDAWFMADHLAVLNMPMAALEAQRDGDLVRSADPAAGAGDDDRASRADRDRLDDVRAALSDRAALRLARPYQRRARRVEPGHDLEPRRGAQFRADRAYGARRALPPRARVLRCRHRAVGQLGRGCFCPRCRERHLFRSRPDACARPPGANSCRCAGRSTSRGRCRAGRSSCRPARRMPDASSPPRPPR